MGKVLKADASVADAFVEIDLGSGHAEVWVSFRLAFDAAALAYWASAGTSPAFVCVLSSADAIKEQVFISDSGTDFYSLWADAAGGVAVADTWTDVELHYKKSPGALTEIYIDGVLVADGTPFSTALIQKVRIGLDTSFYGVPDPDPASVAYIDDVKVGTTDGGFDLFSDDFEDGTLDAWTISSGDVSVVDDPLAAVAGGAVRILVAFTDDTLTEDPDFTDLAALS